MGMEGRLTRVIGLNATLDGLVRRLDLDGGEARGLASELGGPERGYRGAGGSGDAVSAHVASNARRLVVREPEGTNEQDRSTLRGSLEASSIELSYLVQVRGRVRRERGRKIG